jgi:hypothetical protein
MRRLLLPILASMAIVGVLALAMDQARTIVHTAQFVGGIARAMAPPWMKSNPPRSYPRSIRGGPCIVIMTIPLARPGESRAIPIPPAQPGAVQVVPLRPACAPGTIRVTLPPNRTSTARSQ